MQIRLLNHYGIAQIQNYNDRPAKKHTGKREFEIAVCGNCTKAKCRGSGECMMKMKGVGK